MLLKSDLAFLRESIPTSCLICLKPVSRSRAFCFYCESRLPWLESACIRCGLPFKSEQLRDGCCGGCIGRRFPVDRCVSLFSYDTPVRELINAYKHRQRLDIGYSFAELMADQLDPGDCELLLPVPIAYRRFCSRGYNQSWELVRQLSALLQIPSSNHILKKRRHTESQSSQNSIHARKQNLRGAFTLHHPEELQNVHSVTLVDDVVTTMATVSSLASMLKSHRIRDVQVWSIARTCR